MVKFNSNTVLPIAVFNMTDTYGDCGGTAQSERTHKYSHSLRGLLAMWGCFVLQWGIWLWFLWLNDLTWMQEIWMWLLNFSLTLRR